MFDSDLCLQSEQCVRQGFTRADWGDLQQKLQQNYYVASISHYCATIAHYLLTQLL